MKIRNYIISRRLLLILSVGIFVIALAALLFLYVDEVQEKNDLEDELALVESEIDIIVLNIISSQQKYDDLEADIAQNEAGTAAIKTQLTTSLLTSVIFQDMLTVASATNVNITVIGETGITNSTLAGVSYKVRHIDFQVAGSASNIYKFVDKLSQDLNTSILYSMRMETDSDPNVYTSATMRLTIYSYK